MDAPVDAFTACRTPSTVPYSKRPPAVDVVPP